METLLSSQKPVIPFHFPKPSLSLHNLATQTLLLHPNTTTATTWKLHANAKGFGGSPAAKESTVTTTQNKKNSNSENDEDQLPQAVFDRIIARVLVAVGLPMATGIVSMSLFGLVKEQELWDVPKWIPALTMLLTFGGSALGIAYGPLSASWDENRQGSLLGLEEAKRNWVKVWEEDQDDD